MSRCSVTKDYVCEEAAHVLSHYMRQPSRTYATESTSGTTPSHSDDVVKVIHNIEHRHATLSSQLSNNSHHSGESNACSDEVKVQTFIKRPGFSPEEISEIVLQGDTQSPISIELDPSSPTSHLHGNSFSQLSKVIVNHHRPSGSTDHITNISVLDQSGHSSRDGSCSNTWINTTVIHRPGEDVVEVHGRNICRHHSTRSDDVTAARTRIDWPELSNMPNDMNALIAQYANSNQNTLSNGKSSSLSSSLKMASPSRRTESLPRGDQSNNSVGKRFRGPSFMRSLQPWRKEREKSEAHPTTPTEGGHRSTWKTWRFQRLRSRDRSVATGFTHQGSSKHLGEHEAHTAVKHSNASSALFEKDGVTLGQSPLFTSISVDSVGDDIVFAHGTLPASSDVTPEKVVHLRQLHTLPTPGKSPLSLHAQGGGSNDLPATPYTPDSGDDAYSSGRIQKKKKKHSMGFYRLFEMFRNKSTKEITSTRKIQESKLVESMMGMQQQLLPNTRTSYVHVTSEERNSMVIEDFKYVLESETRLANSESGKKISERRNSVTVNLPQETPPPTVSDPTPTSTASSTIYADYRHAIVADFLAKVADGLMNRDLARSQKHRSALKEVLMKMECGNSLSLDKDNCETETLATEGSTTHTSQLSLATTLIGGGDNQTHRCGSRPSSGVSTSSNTTPVAMKPVRQPDLLVSARQRSDTAPTIEPLHRFSDYDKLTRASLRERHKSESGAEPHLLPSGYSQTDLSKHQQSQEPTLTRKMRSKGRLYKNRFDIEIPNLVCKLHNEPFDYNAFERELGEVIHRGDNSHSWREVSLLYYITRKLIRHELTLSLSSTSEDTSGSASGGWSATTVSMSITDAKCPPQYCTVERRATAKSTHQQHLSVESCSHGEIRDSGVDVSPSLINPLAESSFSTSEQMPNDGQVRADQWQQFCLRYFTENLAEWVTQQGGFQSLLEITTDSELD